MHNLTYPQNFPGTNYYYHHWQLENQGIALSPQSLFPAEERGGFLGLPVLNQQALLFALRLAKTAHSWAGRNRFPINASILFGFGNTSRPNSTCQRMSCDSLILFLKRVQYLNGPRVDVKTRIIWMKSIKLEGESRLTIK